MAVSFSPARGDKRENWGYVLSLVDQQPFPQLADQWLLSFPVYRAQPPAIACPSAERQAAVEHPVGAQRPGDDEAHPVESLE